MTRKSLIGLFVFLFISVVQSDKLTSIDSHKVILQSAHHASKSENIATYLLTDI